MKKSKGFTLIELLVVIAIIGLLSSIVLASLNSAREGARDAQRIANVRQVMMALELYFHDHGRYPSIGHDGWGFSWHGLAGPLAPYISTIPRDPLGDGWHIFQYVRGPANAYGILVRRERGGFCRTGVNVNPGWWGTQPSC